MKTIYFALALCMISCANSIGGGRTDPPNNATASTPAKQGVSKDLPTFFVVDKFTLRLSEEERRCVLRYRLKDEEAWKKADMGMEAPCDFVGRRIKKNPPQQYVFNEGANRVTVLLVTGGPPHAIFKDEFMPNGCGTRIEKVRVYSDRVEVEPSLNHNDSPSSEPSPYCPSNPLDDVFFATG
jgi:hypothetical protein